MNTVSTIVPAMDPSCEISHEVLDSHISEREICDDINSIVTPAASTSKTMPLSTLESELLINSKVMANGDLHIPSTAYNILDKSIESITVFAKQLLAGKKKCSSPILRIKELFKTLTTFPNLTTLSDKELLDTIKSMNADNDVILADKKAENSLGLVMLSALYTIKDKLNITSSADQEKHDSLLSINSVIDQLCSEVYLQKRLLKDIEVILWEYDFPFAAGRDLQNAMTFLNRSIELIREEQKQQKKTFRTIQALLESILDPKKDFQIGLLNTGKNTFLDLGNSVKH